MSRRGARARDRARIADSTASGSRVEPLRLGLERRELAAERCRRGLRRRRAARAAPTSSGDRRADPRPPRAQPRARCRARAPGASSTPRGPSYRLESGGANASRTALGGRRCARQERADLRRVLGRVPVARADEPRHDAPSRSDQPASPGSDRLIARRRRFRSGSRRIGNESPRRSRKATHLAGADVDRHRDELEALRARARGRAAPSRASRPRTARTRWPRSSASTDRPRSEASETARRRPTARQREARRRRCRASSGGAIVSELHSVQSTPAASTAATAQLPARPLTRD